MIAAVTVTALLSVGGDDGGHYRARPHSVRSGGTTQCRGYRCSGASPVAQVLRPSAPMSMYVASRGRRCGLPHGGAFRSCGRAGMRVHWHQRRRVRLGGGGCADRRPPRTWRRQRRLRQVVGVGGGTKQTVSRGYSRRALGTGAGLHATRLARVGARCLCRRRRTRRVLQFRRWPCCSGRWLQAAAPAYLRPRLECFCEQDVGTCHGELLCAIYKARRLWRAVFPVALPIL